MNDPNKVINVNLSSLLSLKAELLRKKAEVNKAKATRPTIDEFLAKKSNASQYKQNIEENEQLNNKNQINEINNEEDAELLAKSQRILEAKTKFYERMSRTGGKLNSDDNCLVLFNKKQQKEKSASSNSESDDEEHTKDTSDNEDNWVEYKDCLGRTRKCLRIDLENVKKRDAELSASMPERLDQSKANWLIDTTKQMTTETSDDENSIIGPLPTESLCSEALTVISKQDEVRANWERKEQENLDKPDVHYQDVFFEEARQHGVGYYAFSTDAQERLKQQRDLEATRKKTIEEQEHKDKLREQREKIIAQRVLAAKNRQRARLNLPPITQSDLDAERAKQTETEQLETKQTRKELKKQQKAQRKLKEEEEAREIERLQHIRPWDKNKLPNNKDKEVNEDVWTYKPERLPMSQEEWNEKQRTERKEEFAPPKELPPKRTNFHSNPTNPFKTTNNSFNNYQSLKKEKNFQRRNYEENETIDNNEMQGVMIPPPDNLDNHLPFASKRARSGVELENSIEAGLRFLRNNSDKDGLTKKSSWSAKIDY